MSEKTYVTPLCREPEFVISPMGALNAVGVKIKRQAIKFHANVRGVGQFTTSDIKIQEFLDNHPWTLSHKLECVGETDMIPPDNSEKEEAEKEEAEEKQTIGPATVDGRFRKNKRK